MILRLAKCKPDYMMYRAISPSQSGACFIGRGINFSIEEAHQELTKA